MEFPIVGWDALHSSAKQAYWWKWYACMNMNVRFQEFCHWPFSLRATRPRFYFGFLIDCLKVDEVGSKVHDFWYTFVTFICFHDFFSFVSSDFLKWFLFLEDVLFRWIFLVFRSSSEIRYLFISLYSWYILSTHSFLGDTCTVQVCFLFIVMIVLFQSCCCMTALRAALCS